MYTAERQRAHPYLDHITGPVYEQWYLLHHRMVRIVTNQPLLTQYVRHFLYYAELCAEYTYEQAAQLPVGIPEDLLWQVGERLHRPVALTCYLFETSAGEAFPPAPAEEKPDDIQWEEVTGVEGPLRGRWKRGALRFREFQAYPSLTSRICSVLDTDDLYATIFIEDVRQCVYWFVMRFVFYMVVGAMFGYDGYEIIHAGAVALEGEGALLVGSPGSGKSTLVLGCLHQGLQLLADDVLFLAKDDGLVRVYAFPEDIGIRKGTMKLLSQYEFTQQVTEDEREKRFIDVQQFFGGQVISSCPVRLLLFIDAKSRGEEFQAELLSPAQAVTWLMREYISHQRAQDGGADFMFDIFSDMASQAPAYRLQLTPDVQENAAHVHALLVQSYTRP